MTDFLDGATALACCSIALFFLRFWTQTRDRLFAIFAIAFLVFALGRIVLLVTDREAETAVYVARLLAFALIAVAVVDKNRAAAR